MSNLKQIFHSFSLFRETTPRSTPRSFPFILLGIAQICSWGSLYYSFPQIAQAMINDYQWLKSDVYGALTACLLFSSIAAIPMGKLIDRGHGRTVMTGGSIVAGLVFIMASQIDTLFGLYMVFSAIGVLHAATLYEAAFSIIVSHFEHQTAKQKIVSLTLWGGFASTVFIPLIELSISQFHWQGTFIVLGIINIVVCAGSYAQLPLCHPKKASDTEASNQTGQPHTLRWALRQPIFWALLVCFSLFAAGASTFKFHLYPLLVEKGISLQDVMILMAIMGPSQVLGRFIMKIIGTNVSALQLGIITTTALPLTFFALAILPANTLYYLPFIIIFGSATGIMTIIKGIAVPELLTKQAYGAINGAMNVPIKIIKAFSPLLAALIWISASNYNTVLVILGGVSIMAVVAFSAIKKLAEYTTH